MIDHSIVAPLLTVIGLLIASGIPLATFIFGYGKVCSRLDSLERQIEHSVTREEFRALKDQLSQVVKELQGLRHEIIDVIKASRPATGGM